MKELRIDRVITQLKGLKSHCMDMMKEAEQYEDFSSCCWEHDVKSLEIALDVLQSKSVPAGANVHKVIDGLLGLKYHCEDMARESEKDEDFSSCCWGYDVIALETAINTIQTVGGVA